MFDNMETKDSDENFRLRPIQVQNNSTRSFSPPDLDRIPSNQTVKDYRNLRHTHQSIQSKIDSLSQDVSTIRARLLRSKQDLCEVLNDKSVLLSQLHQQERQNFDLKHNLDHDIPNTTPQKSLEYKSSTLKQQIEIEQMNNKKL